jgi:hypothetical protein
MKFVTVFSFFVNRCQPWLSRRPDQRTASANLYRLTLFHPFLLWATVRFVVLSGKVVNVSESEHYQVYGTKYWLDTKSTQIQKLWIRTKRGTEICREFRDMNLNVRRGDVVSLVRAASTRNSNGSTVAL